MASKKEIRDKENQERLANAISTLDSIARNNNIQKNIRNIVREILTGIKDEKNGSISVRAANTISMLDNVTPKSADAISYTDLTVAGRFNVREYKRIGNSSLKSRRINILGLF